MTVFETLVKGWEAENLKSHGSDYAKGFTDGMRKMFGAFAETPVDGDVIPTREYAMKIMHAALTTEYPQ